MRKIQLFVLLFVLTATQAIAQWSNKVDESLLVYEGIISEPEMAIAPNGATWVYYQVSADENYSKMSVCLQLIDTLGNKVFGDKGLLVSDYPNRSWSLTNQFLFVDRDGNAIVAVHDIRNAVATKFLSYTLYKISQTGEFLWGEDGLSLEGTQAFPTSTHMSMTQIDDNSYVCAWASLNTETELYEVKMQRITSEGEMLWDIEEVKLSDPTGKVSYTWPTVVDAGLNQVIIIYFGGSNFDIYARKIDFDGSSAWSEDTRLYRGGFPQTPAWNLVDIHPSGDGGAIIAWTDDRYMEGSATYMSYVQSNGEIGFAAGVDGQKLSYGDYLGTNVKCMYDPYTDSFLAVWLEAYSSVMFRLMAQRLSKDGELLWGETAYELQPFSTNHYGYASIQTAPDGQAAFFYMHNNLQAQNTESYVTLINTADTTLRRDFLFSDPINVCEKSDLFSSDLHDGKFWTTMWLEGNIGDVVKMYMQRINTDLTLGNSNTSVNTVKTQDLAFSVVSEIAQSNTLFAVDAPQAVNAMLTVYDLSGAVVATPFNGMLNAGKQYIEWNINVPAGIYVATLTTANGVETVKVLVK